MDKNKGSVRNWLTKAIPAVVLVATMVTITTIGCADTTDQETSKIEQLQRGQRDLRNEVEALAEEVQQLNRELSSTDRIETPSAPVQMIEKEVPVEVEVIKEVEVIREVEVPVEVERIVEVEKEIPVEIEREVLVEKEVPVEIQTVSVLKYEVIETGIGESASPGDTAMVHYTGWLTDGTKFDSSRDREQPFEFLLGAGNVIKGWDEAVALMRIGDKWRVTIPPDLAYGDRNVGGGLIPPNSTLVFEIELLDLK